MRTIAWLGGVIWWLIALPIAASNIKSPPSRTPCWQTVTVLTGNYAQVSAELLAAAQLEAERILSEANVRINWVDASAFIGVAESRADPTFRLQPVLTINLLSRAMGARLNRPAKEFGLASGETGYIFYDRIDRIERTAVLLSRGGLLGLILAHEIGHILLGPGAHAPNGLMQSKWYASDLVYAAQGGFRFTPQQIDRLQGRLRNGSRCGDH